VSFRDANRRRLCRDSPSDQGAVKSGECQFGQHIGASPGPARFIAPPDLIACLPPCPYPLRHYALRITTSSNRVHRVYATIAPQHAASDILTRGPNHPSPENQREHLPAGRTRRAASFVASIKLRRHHSSHRAQPQILNLALAAALAFRKLHAHHPPTMPPSARLPVSPPHLVGHPDGSCKQVQ